MLVDIFTRRWFSICVAIAIFYLGVDIFEINRITISFPLESQSQIGAIYSWTNGVHHQKHYLTAAAHRYLFDLTAGLFVYWFAICYASWVRIGKPARYRWSRGSYFEADPQFARKTAYIVMIGIIVSALLASGSLSPVIDEAP